MAALQQFDLIFQNYKDQCAAHTQLLLEMEDPPETTEGNLLDEEQCFVIIRAEDLTDYGYGEIINFLANMQFPLIRVLNIEKISDEKIFPIP